MTGSPRTAPVRLVDLSAADREAVLDLDQWAFAFAADDLDFDAYVGQLEWERAVGAYVEGAADVLAGMNVTLSVRMPVPGGSVAAGALTWVGVHPAHRRRGVLTAMMRRQLDEVRERGEPVSALWAAEPAIYGRFGYGLATRSLSLTLPRGAAMRDVPGSEDLHVTFERLDQDRHTELLAACYEAARQSRPGWVSRPRAAHWRAVLDDQAPLRRGTESLRVLLGP